MAVLKNFKLQCEVCRLTGDDVALIKQQFGLEKVDFPRLYGPATLVISSFQGLTLDQAREGEGFAEALGRLLAFVLVKSDEVFYFPNQLKWTRWSKKCTMTARETAKAFLPDRAHGRVRVQVQRVPAMFPKLDEELATDRYGDLPVNCFSGDGRRLLTVHDNNVAKVWDLGSEALVAEIAVRSPRHGTPLYPRDDDDDEDSELFVTYIEAAVLNHDGTKALLGLNDGSAELYNLRGQRLLSLREPGAELETKGARQTRAIAISPDESMVAVGFFDRKLAIWSAGGDLVRTLQHPLQDRMVTSLGCRDTLASSLSFSPDGRHIFAGFGDTSAGLWNIDSGELLVDASDSAHDLLGMRLVGEELFWSTAGGQVWRCAAGGAAERILDTQEWWHEAATDASGSSVLACTTSGDVHRWDWKGDRTVLGKTSSREYSAGGATVWQSPRTTFHVYKAAQTALRVGSSGVSLDVELSTEIVSFSPSKDERRLLLERLGSKRFSRRSEILDLETGTVASFSEESSEAAVLSVDGRRLARHLQEADMLEIWDLEPQSLLVRIPCTAQIERMEFTVDGSHLVLTDWYGQVGLIETRPPYAGTALHFKDLEQHNLATLSDSRILVFRHSGIEIWRGLETMLARLDVPAISKYSRRKWVLSADESSIVVSIGEHQFARFSTDDGSLLGRYESPVVRPLSNSPLIWQLEGNLYYHQADYLSGGFGLVPVSESAPVTVSNEHDGTAFLVALTGEPSRRRRLDFEGYLRAGWIGSDEVLLLNHRGRLFRTVL